MCLDRQHERFQLEPESRKSICAAIAALTADVGIARLKTLLSEPSKARTNADKIALRAIRSGLAVANAQTDVSEEAFFDRLNHYATHPSDVVGISRGPMGELDIVVELVACNTITTAYLMGHNY